MPASNSHVNNLHPWLSGVTGLHGGEGGGGRPLAGDHHLPLQVHPRRLSKELRLQRCSSGQHSWRGGCSGCCVLIVFSGLPGQFSWRGGCSVHRLWSNCVSRITWPVFLKRWVFCVVLIWWMFCGVLVAFLRHLASLCEEVGVLSVGCVQIAFPGSPGQFSWRGGCSVLFLFGGCSVVFLLHF